MDDEGVQPLQERLMKTYTFTEAEIKLVKQAIRARKKILRGKIVNNLRKISGETPTDLSNEMLQQFISLRTLQIAELEELEERIQ